MLCWLLASSRSRNEQAKQSLIPVEDGAITYSHVFHVTKAPRSAILDRDSRWLLPTPDTRRPRVTVSSYSLFVFYNSKMNGKPTKLNDFPYSECGGSLMAWPHDHPVFRSCHFDASLFIPAFTNRHSNYSHHSLQKAHPLS